MRHCYGSLNRVRQRINKIRWANNAAQFLVYSRHDIFCYYYCSFKKYLISILVTKVPAIMELI